MTGYKYKNDPTIWLMQDNSDRALTNFLAKLIKTYVKAPIARTQCGYACSDHASWTDGGFRAAMPFETEMGSDNPAIHTKADTMEKIALDHISDFAKLGLAFAVELAEPVA
jgi:leucyl aminopeptidase